MGPGVRRDDVDRYNFAFSRHHLPEVLLENLAPQSEGAGKTGCAPHPRSRRLFAIDMLPTSIQVWRKPPAFPAQWLYGLYDVVLVTGLIATIAVRSDCFVTT